VFYEGRPDERMSMRRCEQHVCSLFLSPYSVPSAMSIDFFCWTLNVAEQVPDKMSQL
jgi:hypothetical protein